MSRNVDGSWEPSASTKNSAKIPAIIERKPKIMAGTFCQVFSKINISVAITLPTREQAEKSPFALGLLLKGVGTSSDPHP